MIKISGLYKNFGSKEVLRGVNAEFSRGKIYGIIGENGAGKTTLFRCVAGLEDYKGSIISDLKPLKNHLGLLLSEPYFFAKITGGEYLRLLCNARRQFDKDINVSNVFDLPLNHYVSTYSTGMKKKLALLGVLLQGNDYFIFDEPFNGLDINGSIMLAEILSHLKNIGKTILLSSHIFSTLTDSCDEILVLKDGVVSLSAGRDGFNLLEDKIKSSDLKERIKRIDI